MELFTVDDGDNVGISHGGGLSAASGLVNSNFLGFAADQYNDMKPRLDAGIQSVSLAGVNDLFDLPAFVHPLFGPANGLADIVSVLAWRVDRSASSATIITTRGGVPTRGDVPDPVVPEPAAILLSGMAFGGLPGHGPPVAT